MRTVIAFAAAWLLALPAFAETPAVNDPYGLKATATTAQLPTGGTVSTYTGTIIGAALALSGTIFLAFMIYAGLIWMTAAGEPDKVKKAKSIMINSITGVLLIGLAYAILNFVFAALRAAQ